MVEEYTETGRKRSLPRAVFMIVCAVVLLLVAAGLGIYVLRQPSAYVSTVVVKIEPDPVVATNAAAQSLNTAQISYLMQSQLELIQSGAVLTRVIEELNLSKEWGNRYFGMPLKVTETLALLRAELELKAEPNSQMAEIRVSGQDADETSRIANAIAEAYRDYRRESVQLNATNTFEVAQKQLEIREFEIRSEQTNVNALRTKLAASQTDASVASTGQADTVRRLQYDILTNESATAVMHAQLKQLGDLPLAERREVIQTVLGPDEELGARSREFRVANTNWVGLMKTGDTDKADLQKAQSLAEEALKRVNARVEGIMTGFSNRVRQLEDIGADLRKNLDQARGKDLDRTHHTQSRAELIEVYADATNRLTEMTRARAPLALVADKRRAELMSAKKLVEIVSRATPAIRRTRPDAAGVLVYGGAVGVALALALASAAAWLASPSTPKQRR